MRHPSDGTLRRLVDEPAGVADADRRHVGGCSACLRGLAAARADAEAVARALPVVHDADPDAGWARLAGAVAEGYRRPRRAAGAPRRRATLRGPVAAVVGALVLLAGAGASAAANWLQILRTERIAPVTVTESDLVRLPDLTAYGDLELTGAPAVRAVADAAAAQRATGLSVPRAATLPRGVTGRPRLQVGRQVGAVFTFSAAKAARAAAAAGGTLPAPPPGLDGSRFRLVAGPGLAAIWSEARGVPALVVARAVEPTAFSSGVPFATARDYLLSLPGLPADLAAQLRSFSGDGTTLPLPVPAEAVETSATEVGGVPATLLTTRDGTMAAVVWVQDGVVTAVAGSLSTDEVLAVARGLR